ncbi:subtilisin-like serine protease [Methylocaldum marinum]|uniref:Subtilisin-like serine protease n=1 Tax=Methylocaldum marinum TaxID=1432792 RepID=A0A250KQC7_9GAMM|nr:subtilisin-like serine protease [Methylocaldum marinum]
MGMIGLRYGCRDSNRRVGRQWDSPHILLNLRVGVTAQVGYNPLSNRANMTKYNDKLRRYH